MSSIINLTNQKNTNTTNTNITNINLKNTNTTNANTTNTNTISDTEIRSWAAQKMPQLVQDLIRICKIPSVAVVSEDKQPPYGEACVDVIKEMLAIGNEYGLETKNFDDCVGRIRYGNQEKSIGIWSHLDVVPVGDGWEHDPFDPVVEQGYMIARGCQDNKSSAAMALYVLLYMKEHGISLPYNLDAYVGTSEEVGMFDIDYFVAHYPCPELSLVPDSGFPVCCGERGSFNAELTAKEKVSSRLKELHCDCGLYQVPDLAEAVVADAPGIRKMIESGDADITVEKWYASENTLETASADASGETSSKLPTELSTVALDEPLYWKITCRGIRANGAAPQNGRNALTHLCEVICQYQLADENDCNALSVVIELNKDGHGRALAIFREDEISGPIVLTVTQGQIRDGHLVFGFLSKYPAGCKEDLSTIAQNKASELGFDLHVTRNTKPTLFDPNHPAVQIMTEAYNETTGRQDKPFVMSGGTYARKLPRAFACGTGLPEPPAPEGLFSPGHGDYHQPDEGISLKRIETALVVYIKGILGICENVELI